MIIHIFTDTERIFVDFDAYLSKTTDQIFVRQIPVMTGFKTITTSMGQVNNRGFELTVRSVNVKTKDLVWNSSVTWWLNRNKLIHLYGDDLNNDGKEDDDPGNSRFIGKSLGAIYGYKQDGIVQAEDTEYKTLTSAADGDPKYVSIDDTPGIQSTDRQILGYDKENFRMSFSNNVTWKKFDLYVMLAGNFGGDGYYLRTNPNAYMSRTDRFNDNHIYIPYWTPENISNEYPSAYYSNDGRFLGLQSRGFVRVQDVSLSYTFNQPWVKEAKISSLKVYVSGKNLATFTNWQGGDPETTAQGGRLVKGAVQHNLCELYLALGTQLAAEGKSAEAKTAFGSSISYGDKVINGGTFSPANKVDTLQQQTNYYWDLFQEGSVNFQDGNKECIWAMQIDYAACKLEDGKSKLPYSRTYGPVFRDGSNKHLTGTNEEVGGRGISQIIPTMYARDEIYADKWAADMRNPDVVFRRRFKGNVTGYAYYLKDVPWSAIYNGTADPNTNKNNTSLCYPVSCKIATDKYTGLAEGENRSNLFRDDYFIRLSETILLRAEAKQRNGDKAGAAADINLLRTRAKCSYLVTAADMDDNFNLILDERAREPVYEESRWNTLLRMGGTIAVDRIKKYAFWPEAATTLTFNYNLWPIPKSVIDTNKGEVLDQNPGWSK